MSNHNGSSPFSANAADLNREGHRIQELVEKIQGLPDSAARAMLQECLEATLSFYGHGLERILQIIEKTGVDGRKVHEALVQDGGVSGLLLIHGLHPVPLEKVRPYMQSHGGNVELLRLENEHAVLRLEGHCKTCPSSTVTLELAVRHAIEEACPDLAGFEVEGTVKNGASQGATSFAHVPNAAPDWKRIENTGSLRDGGLMTFQTESEPLLVCRIGSQIYAYHDRCPACNTPLHLGNLQDATLTCGMGHRFDAQHAGMGLDDHDIHLDPVPLLVRDGEVKVALPHVASGAPSHLTEAAAP